MQNRSYSETSNFPPNVLVNMACRFVYVTIYDMLGKAIISERSTKQINTSSLKKGSYIICVELKDELLQTKLLID